MAREKHFIVMKLLEDLAKGKVFTSRSKRLRSALGPAYKGSSTTFLGMEAGVPDLGQTRDLDPFLCRRRSSAPTNRFLRSQRSCQGSPTRRIAALELLGSLRTRTTSLIHSSLSGDPITPGQPRGHLFSPGHQIKENALGGNPDGAHAPTPPEGVYPGSHSRQEKLEPVGR